MRAELVGERPHRLVAGARGHAQRAVALPARFRDQPLEQDAADALAPHAFLDRKRDLRQFVLGLLRRVQFGRAADDAVLHVGHDDGAIVGAAFGIALDETVIEISVKAVVAAFRVEPQQMIAQQRQFFLLAQGTHIAKARPRTKGICISHFKISSQKP